MTLFAPPTTTNQPNTLNGVPQSPTPAPIPNYQDIDLGSIPYLVMMEEHGIKLDPAPLVVMSKDLAVRMDEQQNRAWASVGEAFNLGSNKQVGELLFGKLGFAPTKHTRSRTNWSVEDEVLQALKGQHLVIPCIIEYRRMDKLKGTYVDALPKLVDKSGRIHPRWQGTRVETGRLSCLGPETLVRTPEGLCRLRCIAVGDHVLAPDGSMKRVLSAWDTTDEAVVLKLADGRSITAGFGHKFRTPDGWVEAQNLKVGATLYASLAQIQRPMGGTHPDWLLHTADYEMLGLLFADGYVGGQNGKPYATVLAVGPGDDETVQLAQEAFERWSPGRTPYMRSATSAKGAPYISQVKLNDVSLGTRLRAVGFVGYSHQRELPEWVYTAPRAVVAALLRGYFEGDGTVSQQGVISAKSSSPALLHGVQSMLAELGIRSSVLPTGTPRIGSHHQAYILRIPATHRRVFIEHVGFITERKKRRAGNGRFTGERQAPEYDRVSNIGIDGREGDLYPLLPAYQEHRAWSEALKLFLRNVHDSLAIRHLDALRKWAASNSFMYRPPLWAEIVDGGYREVEIAEIRPAGIQGLRDIMVEGGVFVAEGVVTHNCTDPNVMNQPIRHEEGRQVRRAWVAEKGNILLEADYGQVELRCLAHVTGESNLVDAFWNGDDIHKSTAADVYEINMAAVDFDQRRDAKTVNFGVPYGLSPHGLVESVPIERRDPEIHTLEWATEFMDAYFAKYPRVAEFIALTHDHARKHGWVEDVFRRRRWIPEAMSTQFRVRAGGERMAQNMPIQATAAGIMRNAMGMLIRLDGDGALDPFIEAGAVLTVAQIHDSLIFEVAEALADIIADIVKRTMEAAADWFLVPLVVDVARGNNWIEFKE